MCIYVCTHTHIYICIAYAEFICTHNTFAVSIYVHSTSADSVYCKYDACICMHSTYVESKCMSVYIYIYINK